MKLEPLNPGHVQLICGAGPLSQLRGELFKTFRQRRSIVSVQEYETDKEVTHRLSQKRLVPALRHDKNILYAQADPRKLGA